MACKPLSFLSFRGGKPLAAAIGFCLSGEERDGEGGGKSMAWCGQAALARPTPIRRRVPRLADHTGPSIFLRERKGSSPWCSPRHAGPPGEGRGASNSTSREDRKSTRLNSSH